VGIYFNADEILQMAEQIERNGARFYKRAAAAASKDVGKILLDLAGQEVEHEKIFAEMRAGLSDQERKAPVPDQEGESAAYLQAWADGQVFDVRVDPSEKLTGKETIQEILLTAIGMEKDSIAFYLGMKDAVPGKTGRSAVDRIIKEEMSHMARLSRQLGGYRHQAL
jgi:rubrerythrin